jgi:hypothetical protein
MFNFIVSVVIASQALSTRSGVIVQAQITVDATVQYQGVDSFGISASFQRAEQIYGKFGLSPTNRSKLVDLLFKNTTGTGFTILKMALGQPTTPTKIS